MKASLTSAISMAAILGSGGAALAVNATVLGPQAESTSTTQAPFPETTAPAPTPGVDEFQIPGVGLVSMSTLDGVLVLQSVDANDGVSYTVTETTPGEYEIRFESADQVVTFTARVVDGRIVTTATGTSTQAPVTAPPASTPAAGGGTGAVTGPVGGTPGLEDDDDDDDYDDDHDDDRGEDDDD